MFYPDNANRANRLQQLVDTTAVMQTDISEVAKKMDEKNAKMRDQVNTLLKQNGLTTVDELIEKSKAKMTDSEKAQFEALIAAARKSKAGYDWTYFAGAMLMLPEGGILTGKLCIAAARMAVRTTIIRSLANFFKNSEGASTAAAEAAAQSEKVAAEAMEESMKGVAETGEAGAEVAEAVSVISKVAIFFKWVGAVGFALTVVVGIVEAVQGAEQKKALINAIHNLQSARLCVKFYKAEAMIILQQLETIGQWLDAMTGPRANPAVAAWISDGIIQEITADNGAIDWTGLETDLETQDRQSSNFYGSDDLSKDQVIANAKSEQ